MFSEEERTLRAMANVPSSSLSSSPHRSLVKAYSNSHALTGYTPSPAALTAVKTFVQKLKRINSKLIYLMDPVMGDMGRGFYVDQGCLPIYRDLLPYATIVCPNQFEAQALADKEITDLDSLAGVLQAIHQRGVPHVVITSVDLKESVLNLIGTSAKNGAMVLVGSSNEGQQRPWFIQSPEVEGYFSGVGDLFSALLVGRFQLQTSNSSQEKYEEGPKEGGAPDTDLSLAAEKAVAGLQGVLSKTSEAIAASEPLPTQAEREAAHIDDTQFRVEVMRRRELKVVQSRQAIETPVVQYKARWMS